MGRHGVFLSLGLGHSDLQERKGQKKLRKLGLGVWRYWSLSLMTH